MPEFSDTRSSRTQVHEAMPEKAFIDPYGRNREAIDQLFRQVTSLVLDYASTAATRSPLPNTEAQLDYDQLLDPPPRSKRC